MEHADSGRTLIPTAPDLTGSISMGSGGPVPRGGLPQIKLVHFLSSAKTLS